MADPPKVDTYHNYTQAVASLLALPADLARELEQADKARHDADTRALKVDASAQVGVQRARAASTESYKSAAAVLARLGVAAPPAVRPTPGMKGDDAELREAQQAQARIRTEIDTLSTHAESSARVAARQEAERAAQARAAADALQLRQQQSRQLKAQLEAERAERERLAAQQAISRRHQRAVLLAVTAIVLLAILAFVLL